MRQPLAGIRVLDAGTRIAAPFCAGILGEQGAEVIKIEDPGGGDKTRVNGPFTTDDDGNRYSLYWSVEGRGRKSVTIDLRQPEGQDLFRRLASESDVMCENFRPGTLERWNIDPSRLDPRLVTARITLYGQHGPKSLHTGFDHNAVAFAGLTHITGPADQPPIRPSLPVSDYLTGVFAAQAVTSLLYERDAKGTGTGGVIDAYLYGSVLRIMEWTIAAYDRLGSVRQRTGNQSDQAAPLDNFGSRDGRYVCIVAVRQEVFERLCEAMGQPELATDERFATLGARRRNRDVVNQTVAEWVAGLDSSTIEELCLHHGVPVGVIYDVADMAADDHVRARGDVITVDDPVVGPVRQQAPYPRFDDNPLPVPEGAPRLGEHTDEVLSSLLGLSETELTGLRERHVI
ncbi:MAG: CoA transferase [Acidimicrobiaceae bacterium]|nr:CoA transferase [Acidimicrobiaceae bacterium]MXW62819.1 CoA transferase [Acidimicrobiaceae bacterium]MXW76608.1 CoA transferase [Acidimicrobiaceae bacterium]MYC42809.1 CoA transferase [Acidimicrobiaceae bacterium]MYD08301.1 CoA transferase [Acidimicrobiaceae bacterium]